MSDLPEGWDSYNPNSHELTSDAEYQRSRAAAAESADRRRNAYGQALRYLRQARSLTQARLAEALGVGQGEVSRIEHQADLLLSTFIRYVDGMGGEFSLLVRFPDQEVIEFDGDLLSDLLTEDREFDPRLQLLARKEAEFRDVAAA